jgi:hypothetical protein
MKTLTLIAATGATLALLAPGAGAKNSLNCDSTRGAQAVQVRGTDPATAHEFQVARNLLYIGTWHPASVGTCKALQSAKEAPVVSAGRFQLLRNSI